MDFAPYDRRRYRTVGVPEGYAGWVETYENTVSDEMDLRLLERLDCVEWSVIHKAVDLACGTGRTGAWLKGRGVGSIDGVDLTAPMLRRASAKRAYRHLIAADLRATPLRSAAYDLCIEVLAHEHLPDLQPMYNEAARVVRPRGFFVEVGYHPYFLLDGIPTHYETTSGEHVTIETHLHLFCDHVRAARVAGFTLLAMDERLIDDDVVNVKPNWQKYFGRPISFVLVWLAGQA
jgi:SAM-dependent methyltransferase